MPDLKNNFTAKAISIREYDGAFEGQILLEQYYELCEYSSRILNTISAMVLFKANFDFKELDYSSVPTVIEGGYHNDFTVLLDLHELNSFPTATLTLYFPFDVTNIENSGVLKKMEKELSLRFSENRFCENTMAKTVITKQKRSNY